MYKEKIYCAGPFFNSAQVAIVSRIENLLTERGYKFYSPRLHSGSANFTPEMKKSREKWAKVFQSNIEQLEGCDVLLVIVEYALPEHQSLRLGWDSCDLSSFEPISKLELPDIGTIFELGYLACFAKGHGNPINQTNQKIIGFHSQKAPSQFNLMLSHSLDGVITGFDQLAELFKEDGCDWSVPFSIEGEIE